MASKRIFSLRLSEDVRQKLLDRADQQGITITALINAYISQGLNQSDMAQDASGGARTSVVQPGSYARLSSETRLEELLFQVLQNQRLLIQNSQRSLEKSESAAEKSRAVAT